MYSSVSFNSRMFDGLGPNLETSRYEVSRKRNKLAEFILDNSTERFLDLLEKENQCLSPIVERKLADVFSEMLKSRYRLGLAFFNIATKNRNDLE